MATRRTKTTESTALVNWDEELARQAEAAAAQEANTGGGQFFGLRGGILTFNDAPMPNNEMAVIIADSILENVFYEGDYDPDNPQAPTCFAHGRKEEEMGPHETVVTAGQAQDEGEGCANCPMNTWGSADKGRGKACRNTRRLALLSAGVLDQSGRLKLIEPETLESAAFAYMKLPVTSIRGYATFVKQVAGALKRPPHGIVTKIKVVPDPKTQFRVLFEPLLQVPNELMPIVMKRHAEAEKVIDFPYMLADPEAPAKPAPKGRGPAKAPARTPKGRGKY